MYDENQTFVPESFSALYLDSRKRLTISKAQLAQRSEFCEDLASLLSDQCATVSFRDGIEADQVLEQTMVGLSNAGSGVSADEARWVTHRTAELLGWAWPSRLDA